MTITESLVFLFVGERNLFVLKVRREQWHVSLLHATPFRELPPPSANGRLEGNCVFVQALPPCVREDLSLLEFESSKRLVRRERRFVRSDVLDKI